MRAIAYLRVSTQRQGESGLGLSAQQSAIEQYVKANACELIASYTEIESGKRADRPELAKALAHARRSKATLIVAKLDRLARNVAFLSALMDSTVPFVAIDNQHANRLTLHILAAVAESEALAISERTKAALAAYKRDNRISKRIKALYPDGVPDNVRAATAGKLGGSLEQCRLDLSEEEKIKGQRESARVRRLLMVEAYRDLFPIVLALRAQGQTLKEIADQLTAQGHSTRRGRPFHPQTVLRILQLSA